MRVRTTQTLQFNIGGRKLRMRPQSFSTDCSARTCEIQVSSGRSFRLSRSYLQVLGGRTYAKSRSNYASNSGYSWVDRYLGGRGTGRSELASSGSSHYGPRRSNYRFNYSPAGKNLVSCYRNKAQRYAGKKGCTSGNRHRCGGSKSPYVSTKKCYRYVKLILQDCGATGGRYLGRTYAKNAGPELKAAGFKRLPIMDPKDAPPGAVIVYNNACYASHPAGHIEIKLSDRAYASDYIDSVPRSVRTSCRTVKAIYMRN